MSRHAPSPRSVIQPLRLEVLWPDGSYSIATNQAGEWIVRMPDGTRYGAPRLLALWKVIREAGGVIRRGEDR